MAEVLAFGLGASVIGFLGNKINEQKSYRRSNRREAYENDKIPGSQYTYPAPQQFYAKAQQAANQRAFDKYYGPNSSGQSHNVQQLNQYAGPDGTVPVNLTNAGLTAAGDQMLNYQLFLSATNAGTPDQSQLDAASGYSSDQTGPNSPLQGGVSAEYAPYNIMQAGNSPTYQSEYQAVNLGNPRADSISACAQNSPTFVATSLLPKVTVPGQASWNAGAPQDILANQNFLSATQQIGTDTVLSSLRNASHDIRGDIYNPISVTGPWQQTTITPDPMRRPIIDFIPDQGLYSSPYLGTNGTFVGQTN
jgi:hypothetical protein